MTGHDDGVTATGGLSGITEDTPGHAGAPGEAGSIDGVSAAGANPETYDVSGDAAGTSEEGTGGTPEQVLELTGDDEHGLVVGDAGGVTGTDDL